MARIPRPPRLGALLASSPPLSLLPMPLRDRTPEAGLFGPGSVTWRVIREPILVVGGARALLLQTAHPLVAEGAIDHSTYRSDPYGRLLRTLEWVAVCSFGTTAEAQAACRQVNRRHARVKGRLTRGHSTAEHRPESEYTARNPELLRWVHACFVDTLLVAHDALIGGLDDRERDRMVREWNGVAALMGVRARDRFQSRAELAEYVATEIASGRGRSRRRLPGGGGHGAGPSPARPARAPGHPAVRPRDHRPASPRDADRLRLPLEPSTRGSPPGPLCRAADRPPRPAPAAAHLPGVRLGGAAAAGHPLARADSGRRRGRVAGGGAPA